MEHGIEQKAAVILIQDVRRNIIGAPTSTTVRNNKC